MQRPARSTNLTAKLKDTANAEAPQLSFQRKAVQAFHDSHSAEKDLSTSASVQSAVDLETNAAASNPPSQTVTENGDEEYDEDSDEQPKRRTYIVSTSS